MSKTLKEIAELIDAKILGDEKVVISGVSSIKEAKSGDITFVDNPKYFSYVDQTRASAVIAPENFPKKDKTVLLAKNPSLAFSKAVSFLFPSPVIHPRGIDEAARIDKKAEIGKGAAVGAYSVIGANAVIGPGAVIYPNVYVGYEAKIGAGTVVWPNVTVREKCIVGKNVIIHSGSVIGSDGFGFAEEDGVHHKIPQVGIVEIEDDVEIGACVTIARARFDKTIVRKGTKIDNLVQIAHNVEIGEHSIIVSQSGISGSARLGKHVILAGQVGIVGHIEIGDNVIVGAQSGVSKSLKPNAMYLGSPARDFSQTKKIYVCEGKLPRLFKEIAELKEKIKKVIK
jgi:UDP-3-O-[3-hydroxymyristoyl] glucosamine N-acyltransferase